MRQEHDPLVPHRRNRKPGETSDETEQRLSADLRALMSDDRYRANDPDFRHYVQRQFRRVYDDPSGARRAALRVGRPKAYVSALEPFDRDRERVLRRASEAGVSEGDEERRSNLPSGELRRDGLTVNTKAEYATTKSDHAVFKRRPIDLKETADQNETEEAEPLQERHMYPRGPNAGEAIQAHRENKIIQQERKIQRITAGVEGMIAAAEREGLVMAPIYLRRYLDGVGGVVHLDWSTVRAHGPAARAEQELRGVYADWFTGQEEDKTIGAPFLTLQDGEVLEIGKLWRGSDAWWTRTFHPNFDDEDDRDGSLAFGKGQIASFATLRFERHGDEIEVSGIVAFTLDEPYDFEEFGFKTFFISMFKSDGPVINYYDLKYLAEHGPAAEYRFQARHLAEVSGTIVLVDGAPDPQLSSFVWRDLDKHHS